MKKLVSLFIVSILILVGCKNEENITKITSEDISGTTIRVGVWKGNNGEEAALDKLISEFETTTGAKVEKRVYTDISQQLPTELIGGTAPDVFYIDAILAKSLINDGALEPISNYMMDSDVEDFYPAMLEPFTSDDKIYALPKDWSTLAVFYNEDLLNAAGLSVSDIPEELEKWPEFIENLQAKLPDGKTAFVNTPDISRVFPWIQTNGATILTDDKTANFSSKEIQENSEIIIKLSNSNGSKEGIEIGYDWGGDAFGAGDAAIVIEGPWLLPALNADYPETNFGVKKMPTYNGEKTTAAYTVGWGVNSQAQNLSGAIQFGLYATGKEGMNTWTSGAKVIPSRESVAKAVGVNEDEILNVFNSQADYAHVWQLEDVTTKVINEFNNIFPEILEGNKTIEEGYLQIDEAINKDLKDFNE